MRRALSAAAILAVCTAVDLAAQGPSVSVGVRGSTLGAGLEVALGLGNKVELRGMGNRFSYDGDLDLDNVNYGLDLKLQTGGLLLD